MPPPAARLSLHCSMHGNVLLNTDRKQFLAQQREGVDAADSCSCAWSAWTSTRQRPRTRRRKMSPLIGENEDRLVADLDRELAAFVTVLIKSTWERFEPYMAVYKALECYDLTSPLTLDGQTRAGLQLLCKRFELDYGMVRAGLIEMHNVSGALFEQCGGVLARKLAKENILAFYDENLPILARHDAVLAFVEVGFSIPVASAIVETLFSCEGYVKNRYRSSMKDSTAEMIVHTRDVARVSDNTDVPLLPVDQMLEYDTDKYYKHRITNDIY